MVDLIFKGATIIDGTGAPGYVGDLGVLDGKIVIGAADAAKEEIDCTGKILCPGFIDSHSHMDATLGKLDLLAEESRLFQGITTEMTGQCGSSPFPAEEVEAFFARVQAIPKAGNYCFLQGLGSVRQAVMGYSDARPSAMQLEQMKDYVRRAMEQGCFGVSSGLIYVPGVYSEKEELIALAKEAAKYGGVYATHMRSEADAVEEAVAEAIHIAGDAGCPLVISHHKVMGRRNFGKSEKTLAMIHEAIRRGVRVTMDQYPYEATESSLRNSIPPELCTEGFAVLTERLKDPAVRAYVKDRMCAEDPGYNCGYRNAGSFENIVVASAPEVPSAEGKSIAAYAAEAGKDPFDVFFDLLVLTGCRAQGIFFSVSMEDIRRIYLDENTCVGTDAVFKTAQDHTHPRAFSSFVKTIRQFHKDEGIVTLEEAIRKQTALTAERWGIPGKGKVADGYDADLLVLDYDALQDYGTYAEPRRHAGGIERVYVAGEAVLIDGKRTGAMPGKCVRHGI